MIRSEECLPGKVPSERMDMSPTTREIMKETQVEADEKMALEMARELEQLQAEAVKLEQMKVLHDLEMEELELQPLLQQQRALTLSQAAASAGLIPPEENKVSPAVVDTTAMNPEVRKTDAVNPEVPATKENPEVQASAAVNPEVRTGAAANPEVPATEVKAEIPAVAAVIPEVRATDENPEVRATNENPEVRATAAVNPEVRATVPEVELGAAPASTAKVGAFAAHKIHTGAMGWLSAVWDSSYRSIMHSWISGIDNVETQPMDFGPITGIPTTCDSAVPLAEPSSAKDAVEATGL